MRKDRQTLAERAAQLWDCRALEELTALCNTSGPDKVPEMWFYAGLAHDAQNRKQEAIRSWRQAIALNGAYNAPIRALAYEMAAQDYLVESAKLFAELVRLQAADAADLTALAEIHLTQGTLGEALDCLRKALEQEPDNGLALLGMASLYGRLHDRAQTLRYLREVAQTEELDLADLASDPGFEFLWRDREFERLIAPTTVQP